MFQLSIAAYRSTSNLLDQNNKHDHRYYESRTGIGYSGDEVSLLCGVCVFSLKDLHD